MASPELNKTARFRKTASAVPRPRSSSIRPFTASRPRRPYSAYTSRGSDEDTPKFDAPETDREWWRGFVKETPVPGSYQHKSFTEELQSQTKTYGFRAVGRRPTSARFYSSGEVLLPGAYDHPDFLHDLMHRSATYNFQAANRDAGPKIGHGYGDKDLNTSPVWYDLRQTETSQFEKDRNMKQSTFKSHVDRIIESNHQFRVVSGPSPGQYDDKNTTRPSSATVNSVFVSKVPRFNERNSRVPGPGTYNISTSAFGAPKPLPAISHHLKKKGVIAM
ncbi:PREDICTED: uncharacterized protein C2orf61-like [Amphimedon queenslandica]|uniref:Uncharacterized protein n=1 Tax=Amphimedon queenslandica TaxID=400682 RepID=A0A1X7VBG6_AMPQE|nr:PREDICTED: uncharacterized protein C2orf61-like [Amphimedon queenslandica]|eukprot:XP_019849828.1 PREDICTED: uncharacterized protein C2orf61-like [Amphimedon queenslandica]